MEARQVTRYLLAIPVFIGLAVLLVLGGVRLERE